MKSTSFLLTSAASSVPEAAAALDSPGTVVLAFGTPDRAVAAPLVAALAAAFPKSHVIGCSTAGEIHGASIHDASLSVAVARFDDATVRSASVAVASPSDSEAAGEELLRRLHGDDLRAVFVLSEGIHVNGSRLALGMNREAKGAVITGGLAGDGDRFAGTWVLSGGELKDHTVAAIALYGSHVGIGHGSKGGWDRFGLPLTVTRVEGNVVYELNGKPALSVYRDYLGELAAGLPATALLFPLSIRTGDLGGDGLVRTVLSVDESKQSMTFAGDIATGASVHFMRADFDRLIDGASEAAKKTNEAAAMGAAHGDSLSIAVSCVGRRLVLGERAEEEVESARDGLPKSTTLVGFYSYGELSPLTPGPCELHNQTMTLTTVFER